MLQWLSEDLEERLRTVWTALVPGGRVHRAAHSAPEAPDEPWVWWQQASSAAPDAVLFLGLPAASWAELTPVAAQSALWQAAPAEEASQALLRILANACAAVLPGTAGRAGPAAQAPAGESLRFSLEAAGAQCLLVMRFTPPLLRVLEAQLGGREAETAPVLLHLDLPVSISLGRALLPFRDLLQISAGSVVELDRMLGEPVDVMVNDSVIARGEIVVVEGNYGVRIQEVVGGSGPALSRG